VNDVTLAMQGAVSDIGRLFTSRTFVAMAWQACCWRWAAGAVGVSFLVRKPQPQE